MGSHSHHGEPWGSGSSCPGARVPRGSLVPHILRVRVPRVSMVPCIPGLGSPGVSLLSVIPQVRIPSPGPPRGGVRPPGSPHPSRWCDLGCPCGALSSPKVPSRQQPWVGHGFVGDPIILRTGVCALVPGICRCLGFSPVPWGHLRWGSPRVPVGVPPSAPRAGICFLGSFQPRTWGLLPGVPMSPCRLPAPLCPRGWNLHPRDPISLGPTGPFHGVPIRPWGPSQSPWSPSVPVESPVPSALAEGVGTGSGAACPGLQEPQVQHADHPRRHHSAQTGHPGTAVGPCVPCLPASAHR